MGVGSSSPSKPRSGSRANIEVTGLQLASPSAAQFAASDQNNRLLINGTANNGASSSAMNLLSLGAFRKVGSKPELRERLFTNQRSMLEFDTLFDKQAELGSGITGTVYLVTDRRTGKDWAMKTINLGQINKAQLKELKREMVLLRTIDHPNIIKLTETFEDDGSVILIMDLCRGGTLVSPTGRVRLRTEHAVKTVLHQLLQAVKFMHDRGIVHRDVKLENIMFESEDETDLKVVLIDFGFSVLERGNGTTHHRFTTHKRQRRLLTTNCGTAYYMAPEVIKGQYGKECDVWSLGVMAYILLTGSPPFFGQGTGEIYGAIRRGKPSFAQPIWRKLDKSAAALVESLLLSDPNKRCTADQALASDWFKTIHPPWSSQDLQLEQNVVAALERFANFTKLKKTAMLVLAHHCTGKEVSALRSLFLSLDSDHSGTISFAELEKVLMRHGMVDSEEAHRLFADADVDGSGGLQLTEFIAATMEATLTIDSQRMGQAFESIAGGEEFITVDHLQGLLGNTPQVRDIVLAADVNQDGKISLEEFMLMVSEKHEREVIAPLETAFPQLEKAKSERLQLLQMPQEEEEEEE